MFVSWAQASDARLLNYMPQAMECCMCIAALQDGTERQALPCAHVFHAECLSRYGAAKGRPWEDLPCPVCNLIPSLNLQACSAQVEFPPVVVPTLTIEDPPQQEVRFVPAESATGREHVDEAIGEAVIEPTAAVAEDVTMETNSNAAVDETADPIAENTNKNPPANSLNEANHRSANVLELLGARSSTVSIADASQPQQDSIASPDSVQLGGLDSVHRDNHTTIRYNSPGGGVVCHYCGEACEMRPKNIISKRRKEYRCNQCMVTRTILFRKNLFPDMSSFTMAEERHRHFIQMKSLDTDGKVELGTMHKKNMTAASTDTTEYLEGGQFLPPTVWAAKGFDDRRIAEVSCPEDTDEHPVLGITYRVSVKGNWSKRSFGSAFEDEASSTASSARESAAKLASALEEKKKQEKQALIEKEAHLKVFSRRTVVATGIKKALQTIRGAIDAEQDPSSLLAVDQMVEKLTTATAAVETSLDESNLKEMANTIESARLLLRAMRVMHQ